MKVLKLETQSAPQNVVIMWLLETDQVPTGCKDPVSFIEEKNDDKFIYAVNFS